MYVISIILQCLVFILGLFLLYMFKSYYPKYFEEKGKNLATKEDVGEITDLIEGVKHTFTTETEKLKVKLNLISNIQGSLVMEERAAIIDFNEKYFAWLNILIDTSFENIDMDVNSEIDAAIKNMRLKYIAFLNSETRFNLFIQNATLNEKADEMKLETLKQLTGFPEVYLIDRKHINDKIEIMRQYTPVNEQTEKYKALLEEKKELYGEYARSQIKRFEPIAIINRKFQVECRAYLYKLINEGGINI